ncbi:MAG: terminase TerL endonuclease subunit, partial [Bacteroidota bacterium]|nr:terminase TerL endonuclease subunit [Bacteroidota bacterium]
EQAAICFKRAADMIAFDPKLSKYSRTSKARHYNYKEKGKSTGEMRALASESNTLDGLRVTFGILDEIHAYKDINLFDVIKSSQDTMQNTHLMMITTAGFLTTGFCMDEYNYATKALEGKVTADEEFIYIAELDSLREWKEPEKYIKANPNLGKSVILEKLIQDKEKAVVDTESKKSFISKNCNIFLNANSRHFDFQTFKENTGNFDINDNKLKDLTWYGGVDLSNRLDLTSVSLVAFDADENLYILNKSFIPEAQIINKEKYDRMKVLSWKEAGYLNICAGNSVDYEYVHQFFNHYRNIGVNIRFIGFDRWGSFSISEEMEKDNYQCFDISPNNILQINHMRIDLGNFDSTVSAINDIYRKNRGKNVLALDFHLDNSYDSGYRILYYGKSNHSLKMSAFLSDKVLGRYQSLNIPKKPNAIGNPLGFISYCIPDAYIIMVEGAYSTKDIDCIFQDNDKLRFLAIDYAKAIINLLQLDGNCKPKEQYRVLYNAEKYDDFHKDLVKSDFDSNIVVFDNHRLCRYNNYNWDTIYAYGSGYANDFISDASDDYWTASDGIMHLFGPDFWNPANWIDYNQGLPHMNCLSIERDSSGILWVGTDNGMAYLQGNIFIPVNIPSDDFGKKIYDIRNDYEENLWIASNYGVACKTDTTWEFYFKTDGLANNLVSDIEIADDSTIWFATASGVSVLTDTGMYSIKKSDGLIHRHTRCLEQDHLGNMWIGTHHGISMLHNAVQVLENKEIKSQTSIDIFPNPAKDKLIISSSSETIPIAGIEIYNLSGQLLRKTSINKKQGTIDVSGLSPGNYFIRATGKNDVWVKKFVVMR